MELYVAAEVIAAKQDITLIPSRVDFGSIPIGFEVSKEVLLQGDDALLAELPETIVLMNPIERARLRYAGTSGRPGHKRVKLSLTIPAGAVGELIDTAETLDIEGPEPQKLTIPYRARLVSGEQASGDQLLTNGR